MLFLFLVVYFFSDEIYLILGFFAASPLKITINFELGFFWLQKKYTGGPPLVRSPLVRFPLVRIGIAM